MTKGKKKVVVDDEWRQTSVEKRLEHSLVKVRSYGLPSLPPSPPHGVGGWGKEGGGASMWPLCDVLLVCRALISLLWRIRRKRDGIWSCILGHSMSLKDH